MKYHRLVEPHFGFLTLVVGAALLLGAGLSRLRAKRLLWVKSGKYAAAPAGR